MNAGCNIGGRILRTCLRASQHGNLLTRSAIATASTSVGAGSRTTCTKQTHIRRSIARYSTADGLGGEPPNNTPDNVLAGSPRLYQALRRAINDNKPNDVWVLFRHISHSPEWSMISELDVSRVLRIFNCQFVFERNAEALARGHRIAELIRERDIKLTSPTVLNECIWLNINSKKHDAAYMMKDEMDAGAFGEGIVPDRHTYMAILNDVHASTLEDLTRLIGFYDEMMSRGIESDELLRKPLIRLARKLGEHRLLGVLLGPSDNENSTEVHDPLVAARMLCNKGQAYIAQYDIKGAVAQLEKLLQYRLPKDTQRLPETIGHVSGTEDISIPLELTRTRETFFIYIRSLYESIIRIYIIRRRSLRAHELFDEMRRTIYLPPSRMAYNWFIRFHSKRKHIQKLHELHDMMLQDGVTPDEYAYTKFITACMFRPSPQRVETLINKAARQGKIRVGLDTTKEQPTRKSTVTAGIDEPEEPALQGAGLPNVPRQSAELASIHDMVYHPLACTRFYQSMFLEYDGNINDSRDENCLPNIHITNAIMDAYTMLDKPSLVLREFIRFVYHRCRLYPNQRPPDVINSITSAAHIFRMALNAAEKTKSRTMPQKILAQMVRWRVTLPTSASKEEPPPP